MGDSGDGGDGSFGMPPADCRNCHPYPLHDGHDDGDGVLDTATTIKIIVTPSRIVTFIMEGFNFDMPSIVGTGVTVHYPMLLTQTPHIHI